MGEQTTKPGLKGIDGWLLIFLVLCVCTSIFYLLVLLSLLRHEDAWYQLTGERRALWIQAEFWVVPLTKAAVPMIVLWRMVVSRRWSTILRCIALIWGLFIGLPLLDFAYVLVFQGDPGRIFSRIVTSLGWGAVLASAATAFLITSRRVAATYPRNPDLGPVFD